MTENKTTVSGVANAGVIQLAIGIGNPDEEYQKTRHNIGACLIKELIKHENLAAPTALSDTESLISGTADTVRLGLTTTYMNDSGIAVGKASKFLKIEAKNILIMHDEVDLPVGVMRFKFGGGFAGHNGLKSIKQHLTTDQFWRLRIGVGKPVFGEEYPEKAGQINKEKVRDFVVEEPSSAEWDKINQGFKVVMQYWDLIKQGKMDSAIKSIHSNC